MLCHCTGKPFFCFVGIKVARMPGCNGFTEEQGMWHSSEKNHTSTINICVACSATHLSCIFYLKQHLQATIVTPHTVGVLSRLVALNMTHSHNACSVLYTMTTSVVKAINVKSRLPCFINA